MSKHSEELYVCDCGQEGLTIEVDYDYPDIYLSLWDRGLSPRRYDIRYKLRLIWRVLTKGYAWTDSICLCPDHAKEVGKRLIKEAKALEHFRERKCKSTIDLLSNSKPVKKGKKK